jgi:transcriptional regulator with XRE-family HTH domain
MEAERVGEQGHDMISIAELPGLAGYVQARRVEMYLTYAQLAERLSTDLKWLFRLEDGELPAISPAMLVRLAVALEVDQAILMHHARLPGRFASSDPSGYRGTRITEREGPPGRITEDLLLFSDRQPEEDRIHITPLPRRPERPVDEGPERTSSGRREERA